MVSSYSIPGEKADEMMGWSVEDFINSLIQSRDQLLNSFRAKHNLINLSEIEKRDKSLKNLNESIDKLEKEFLNAIEKRPTDETSQDVDTSYYGSENDYSESREELDHLSPRLKTEVCSKPAQLPQ